VTPPVSVVVATYDGAPLLPEAVDSALAQTLAGVETIVVDDGSTDETAAVMARYGDRVRYVRQENGGPSAARNTGLRAARGRYVAFLDHDDRWLPAKLSRQAAVLDAAPDVGFVNCGWWFIDGDGARLPQEGWPQGSDAPLSLLLVGNPLLLSAVLVRRDLAERIGGFDEALRGAEDWDFWLKVAFTGCRLGCVAEALLEYRVHPGQRNQTGIRRRQDARLEVIRRSFARPDLPPALRALQPEAIARQQLRAAVDWFRAGERVAGNTAFAAAVAAKPALVTDAAALRHLCHLFVPMGLDPRTEVTRRWREILGIVRGALTDLFARPDLPPEVAALRGRSRRALLAVAIRLARRRLRSALGRA
jgi:hypothetical protein